MGASLCAGRGAFPEEHDSDHMYVQNAIYGQQSYAKPANVQDARQKAPGGRETSYGASRFEADYMRRTESGRNGRQRGEVNPSRSKRDLRVDIPANLPGNQGPPTSASTPQTPVEDDYFNSVEEPILNMSHNSSDNLQRMIDTVGPPLDQSERLRWAKGQLIGAGAFGRVYMGMNLDSGELLAVKQVLLATSNTSKEKIQEHLKGLEAEVAVLRNLSHPNIVRYLGTDREEECLNIFLEFVPGGSIASLLSKFGCFKETVIRRYTCQLLLGLEYLHNHQIMHRDIKGANILVDNRGVIKLADFGASKKLADLATMSEGFKSMKGTPYWMAPEVIKQTGHGRQADIWSVGCTVIEMATGKPPWSQYSSGVSALFHIASSKGPPPLPDCLTPEGRDFLLKCLRRDPKERPSATELLRHPFIADAGLERSSIVSSTYLPSMHSPHTPVLTSGTFTNTPSRNPPSYTPTWNKHKPPPPAPLPLDVSYDDSVQQGSVVADFGPPSVNRSIAYEGQLRPIGEDLSASREEYSPNDGGYREVRRSRNGHREQSDNEEEAKFRNMVQFPTGLGVGDYNNLSMMNSYNPMEEPTLVGNVNIVHWDSNLSEDEEHSSSNSRRQPAEGDAGNGGTPNASASHENSGLSKQSSQDVGKEVTSKAEEEVVNEDTIMKFLDEQAKKFQELLVPLEEQANSSIRDSGNSEANSEESGGFEATSQQQEAYEGSPSPEEEQDNGYSEEHHDRASNGYDSYTSPQGNGYPDSYDSPKRLNGYAPDPFRESFEAAPRSFRGSSRGGYASNRKVPQSEPPRARSSIGAGPSNEEAYLRPVEAASPMRPHAPVADVDADSPMRARARSARNFGEAGSAGTNGSEKVFAASPMRARARSARNFREAGSAGTSGSSRSSREGSDASVVPSVKRAISMETPLDVRNVQPILSESFKDGPLSKEEQWKQELARELDSVRVKTDYHRRSVARQSDDRGAPVSYLGSPYAQRESSFVRQSSRLGPNPLTPR